MQETQKRSLAKTISWRILATLTTFTLVYMFTNNMVIAAEIGGLEIVAKLLFYYFHERVRNSVCWGVKK